MSDEQQSARVNTYRCASCGSDQIEGTSWLDLNTDEAGDEYNDDTWCRACERHEAGLCLVENATGRCTFHHQPFAVCRSEETASEEPEKGEPACPASTKSATRTCTKP